MSIVWKRLSAGSAVALALTAGMAARAQEADAAPAAQSGREEIIVTAQRRTERLREIPQSVTVISERTFERQNATRFEDYAGLIPSFSLESETPGQTRITLRGVNTGGTSATVGVYVDETPFGSTSGLANGAILAGDFDTFDVARLEVLRGPQGNLYGASSLGGVLKFVTNKPSTAGVEVRARLGLETVKGGEIGYSGTGVVNVPLSSQLAVRASGFYRRVGGFVDAHGLFGSREEEDINDAEIYGGRLSLLFTPSEKLSLRVSAQLQDVLASASSAVTVDPVTLRPLYGGTASWSVYPEEHRTRYRLYNAEANIDLDFANLVSSSSYGRFDQFFSGDYTYAFGDLVTALYGSATRPLGLVLFQKTHTEKLTQEFRLASQGTKTVDWQAGLFYNHERSRIHQQFFGFERRDAERQDLATDLPELGLIQLPSRLTEYAGFANLTWNLADRIHLSAGGRLSYNKQSAEQSVDGTLVGGAVTYPTYRSSDTVATYSVSPRFDLAENASIYFRMASGYRPGGPNVVPPAAPDAVPRAYKADSIVSYEAGFKADALAGKLSLDLSLFHLDWKDVQVAVTIAGTGAVANAGKAFSEGLEFSATARPTEGLSITFSGAYIRARLKEDAPDIGGRSGDRLPFSPNWSAATNVDYDWQIAPGLTSFIGGGVRIVGRQSADFDKLYRGTHDRQRELPTYAVVDLRAGLNFGQFSVEAFARNLTNARGYTSFNKPSPFIPDGAATAGLIRPQSFGLSIGAQF